MNRLVLLAFAIGTAVLCGGAALYWRSEALRTAGHSTRLATAAGAAEAAASSARAADRAAIADLEGSMAARDGVIEDLQTRLAAALEQVRAVNAAVADRREQLEHDRAEFAARRARTVAPMPEGVRRAVLAFEECLAHDGHNGLRLLDARSLTADGFGAIELLVAGSDHLPSAFYFVEKLQIVIDRERSEVELRFCGGRVLQGGASEELPADGITIRLRDIDGPYWERRLATIATAVGEYPVVRAELEAQRRMDPLTMDAWRWRLQDLLARGGTELAWDFGRFRLLDGAHFLDASIHGYGTDGLLAQSASAGRLAVEIDRELGTVSLLLFDGVLRKAGGDTTIPASGYRMLLPSLKPQDAIDAMLGLVIETR